MRPATRPATRPAMRPVLRPGLRLLCSASGRAVLVEHDRVYPLDETTAALLQRLDGITCEPDVLADATADDDAPAAWTAWTRLKEAGVVVDLEEPTGLVRDLDVPARAQGLHEASALMAHDPAGATLRWRSRREARVVVAGAGTVVTPLRRLLQDAGIGEVRGVRDVGDAEPGCTATGDAALTVLADDHEPATDVAELLLRAGLPFLVAGMRGDAGTVGPLVLPGATPCLRCVDLTRRQHDPEWAGVRDQLSRPDRSVTPAPAACAVTTAVAALAAAEVLALVEGRTPATTAATASLTLASPVPTLRRWPLQPACGCAWHTYSAALAAQGQWSA
jgi:bacteriocin biosynthesis cyclodehydratase domain-containing protein